MDLLHLQLNDGQYHGARILRDQLVWTGIAVGRRRVGTLMRRMGIGAFELATNPAGHSWIFSPPK